MIRRNEERIGRPHAYFEADPYDRDPFEAGGGGEGGATNDWRMGVTTEEAMENLYPGGGKNPMDSGNWTGTGKGTPATKGNPLTGTNYTAIDVKGSSSPVTSPEAAQDAARSANAERAAESAEKRATGTGAIKERMNVTTRTEGTTLTTKDTITGLPGNLLGKGSVQEKLQQQMDAARKTGLRDAQAILESGGTMDEALDAYLKKVANEGSMTTPDGSYTRLNNDLFLEDLQGIRDAFSSREKEVAEKAKAGKASAEEVKAAKKSDETKSNAEKIAKDELETADENDAADKGKKAATEAKSGGDDSTSQDINEGFATAALESVMEGKSPSVAQLFIAGAQVVAAARGEAVVMNTGTPRLRNSISGFAQNISEKATSEEGMAIMNEQLNSFSNSVVKSSIVELAAELGLSPEKVAELKQTIDAITGNGSIEERIKAFSNLLNSLNELATKSDRSSSIVYKMLTGLFNKQVDKATEIAKEAELQSNVFASQLSDEEADELLDTAGKPVAEEEQKFAKLIEAAAEKIKASTSIDNIVKVATIDTETIYEMSRTRLNTFTQGYAANSSMLKAASSVVVEPGCPESVEEAEFYGSEAEAYDKTGQILPPNFEMTMEEEEAPEMTPEGKENIKSAGRPSFLRRVLNKFFPVGTNSRECDRNIAKAGAKLVLNLIYGNILGVIKQVANIAANSAAKKKIENSEDKGQEEVLKLPKGTKPTANSTDPNYTDEGLNALEVLEQGSYYEKKQPKDISFESTLELVKKISDGYEYTTEVESTMEQPIDILEDEGNVVENENEGFNEGVGAEDEEIRRMISNNINRDAIARRLANEL